MKTKQPIIVALVGLVGSGKTSVARDLAKYLHAEVIEGDAIRVRLRKEKLDYEKARAIAEALAEEYVRCEKNVVIDSDFIDANKRKVLEKKARVFGARVAYVRVCVNHDAAIGRIMSAPYRKSQDDFFGGASSVWRGKQSGAVVKVREFWRRTPHHYRWSEKDGGAWISRKLPFVDFMVDTTDWKTWKKQVVEIARKLKK